MPVLHNTMYNKVPPCKFAVPCIAWPFYAWSFYAVSAVAMMLSTDVAWQTVLSLLKCVGGRWGVRDACRRGDELPVLAGLLAGQLGSRMQCFESNIATGCVWGCIIHIWIFTETTAVAGAFIGLSFVRTCCQFITSRDNGHGTDDQEADSAAVAGALPYAVMQLCVMFTLSP